MNNSTEKWSLLVPMDCMAALQDSRNKDRAFDEEEESGLDDESMEEVALFSMCSNTQSPSFFCEARGYSRDFWFYFFTSVSLAPPTMFLYCLMIFIADQVSLKEIFDPKEPYLAWLIAAPTAALLLTVLCYTAAYLHITYAPISEKTSATGAKPHPLLQA